MIKSTLFALVILFTLSACQGRGLPLHPSVHKPLERTVKKNLIVEKNDTAEDNASEEFMTLKLKGKSLANDTSLLSSIPLLNKLSTKIFPDINKIPVIRDVKKLIPEGSEEAKARVNKKYKNYKSESFSGGTVSDGLDIGLVRLGQSSTYTRLIFDSYKWEGHAQLPIHTVNHSGTYIFTHEPKKNRITAIIDGYRAFSALVGDQSELYRGNPVVDTIRLEEYLDDSGFKFAIELKKDVKVYVYELHNPARIIVDMIPR